jgi:pyruvate kinase
MLLLSNNLRGKIQFPKDAVVRVNSAWVKTEEELSQILTKNHDRYVFLDFPSGRTKPPRPTLTLMQLLQAIRLNKNVQYFAVSNAEDEEQLENIKNLIGEVELVPKIETIIGVENIRKIQKASKCKIVMLDVEDLYVCCKADTKLYQNNINKLYRKCKELNIKVIRLCGVAFEEVSLG